MKKVMKFIHITQRYINREFLKDTQDDAKEYEYISGTGCKSNPKDSFKFVQKKPVELSNYEIEMLTIQS